MSGYWASNYDYLEVMRMRDDIDDPDYRDTNVGLGMVPEKEPARTANEILREDLSTANRALLSAYAAIRYADRVLFTAPGLVYEAWAKEYETTIKAARKATL